MSVRAANTATVIFDLCQIDDLKLVLGIAILLLLCVALYSTAPRWRWERRR